MSQTLGYITPVRAFSCEGKIYMQAASGRVAEALARHYEKVCVCTRVVQGAPPAPFDPPLNAPNLELITQPYCGSMAESLLHFFGIARAYVQTCRRSDVLFVRGMGPFTGFLFLCAALFRKPICYWVVSDPATLLRTHSRRGPVLDLLAWLYALQDRHVTRLGRWITDRALIFARREVAFAHASPRTIGGDSGT